MSVKNHDYCYMEMPRKAKKLLKYIHEEKSTNVPFVDYTDTESLLHESRYMS